jgi:hypothetical protein
MGAFAVQVAGLKSSLHARYPAREKVLAKTRMWEEREAAHCTRAAMELSTARTRSAESKTHAGRRAKVVDNCAELS